MKQYITGFITAVCLTTSVFMFVGAQNTNLGDIEVTSLRIMGDNGSEILLIGRGIVMSKNKKPMVTLFCEDIGGFISTFNADFKETTYLGTNAGGDGHIETFNADGKTTAFLGTGGSGGGVLSSWIVGKTDRFNAAVVAKPVINWYSFVLYADNVSFFYKYWFPGLPWDHLDQYMERSPISYVGNVKTPTMLLTGEQDFRTPMAESEQFYAGLKLNKVESMLVRIPGASHGIAARPSNLIAKVNAITAWFEKYKK